MNFQEIGGNRFGFGGLAVEQNHHYNANNFNKNTPVSQEDNTFHQLVVGGMGAEHGSRDSYFAANAVTAPPTPLPQRVNFSTSQVLGGDAPLDRDSSCTVPKEPLATGLLENLFQTVTAFFSGRELPPGEECLEPQQVAQVPEKSVAQKESAAVAEEHPPVPVPPPRIKTPYDGIIRRAAEAHDVNEGLIRAMIAEESRFNPAAKSREGAMGLMQLMPRTAKELGVQRPFHPEDNVMGGTLYMSRLLDRYDGDLKLALTAYNWGPTNLEHHPQRIPQATQRYVSNIMARMDNQENMFNT